MTLEDEFPKSEGVQYTIGEWQKRITNSCRMIEAAGSKQIWHSFVDASGDESEIQCCKNSIGAWNIRPMNQGKLYMAKQEMVRINIYILGISKLKWIEIGKFNSGDHLIYYCGQESHRRNGVPLIINKRVWNTAFKCNLKNDWIILVHFQDKLFNITVIQIYAATTHAKEAEVDEFYEDLEDLLEITFKKDVLFIIRDWNAKEGNQDIPSHMEITNW